MTDALKRLIIKDIKERIESDNIKNPTTNQLRKYAKESWNYRSIYIVERDNKFMLRLKDYVNVALEYKIFEGL